ncbi:MAG TPA: thioredoxin family protein [Thermoanaerobaculia bacterium]|nr:thioredoxin family protein [Thermoanaerobaculia bacterium]
MRSLLTVSVLLLAAVAANASSEPVEWLAVERDVWIDQRLERPVLLFRTASPERLLLLSDRFRDAIVLDIETGRAGSLRKTDVEPDKELSRAIAPLPSFVRALGSVAKTEDGVVTARVGRRTVMIAPHQSEAGQLDVTRLLGDFPSWDARRRLYEPDAATIARLRQIDVPVELTVVLATWCGDSRRDVPRLLKAVECAENPLLRVRLVGIDSDFHEPMAEIRDRKIINVPTVIVEQNGEEIGRIVETTASDSIEGDLLAILEGVPLAHPGRWERQARLASGSYDIRFAGGGSATEQWEIFTTSSGGRLAHSIIVSGILTREVWHRFDGKGRTEFVEITDRTPGGLRRTRYRMGDTRLSVHSRGNLSGIVDQTVAIPQSCAFSSGSIVTSGWECVPLRAEGVTELARYVVPLDDCAVLGTVGTMRLDHAASAEIELAHGTYSTDTLVIEAGGGKRVRMWIGTGLEVALRIEGDGWTAELTELAIDAA